MAKLSGLNEALTRRVLLKTKMEKTLENTTLTNETIFHFNIYFRNDGT